jgi:hypothetical protein
MLKVRKDALPLCYRTAKPFKNNAEGQKQRITVSVHCECAVALRMLQELGLLDIAGNINDPIGGHNPSASGDATMPAANPAPPPGPIKVGVSKRTCRLCQRFLLTLRTPDGSEPRILLRSFSGKCPSGWRVPPQAPAFMAADMLSYIREEVEYIITKVANWEGSDSEPSGLGMSDPSDSETGDEGDVVHSMPT